MGLGMLPLTPRRIRKTLDPMLDVVFKMLLTDPANRELLLCFLQDFLKPEVPIVDVVVLNPETVRQGVGERSAIVDLMMALADGERVHVEIQLRGHDAFVPRSVFYWARTYAGQLSPGMSYEKLKPTTGIFILDYSELPGDNYYSIFELRERERHTRLSDVLALHYLELPKIPRELLAARGLEPVLRWAAFFSARTDEELHAYAMEDPILSQAEAALQRLSQDPIARELAYRREIELGDYNARLEQREAKGEARGRAEGEVAALLASIERFCAASGIELSAERVTWLRSKDTVELLDISTHLALHRCWPE